MNGKELLNDERLRGENLKFDKRCPRYTIAHNANLCAGPCRLRLIMLLISNTKKIEVRTNAGERATKIVIYADRLIK
ncbi:uncharacterized protein LOC106095336 isoform X2 [Stomoxys calcitrans]|uniref:Uncharacterized protein n=1 Tax=Stomoxys calcitrans TaxID=35570 RepID=A0A1I8P1J8_STOCA|nr:uncharacterized protein LOC106095336 isoform X2 [Stomoxys calcitrans]